MLHVTRDELLAVVPSRMYPEGISAADRLWRHVRRGAPDDCWEWQAGRNRGGYGRMEIGHPRRSFGAHRAAYLLCVGDIPDGLDVLHSCDNPPCCNPAHLFLGTDCDNASDCIAKGRKAVGAATNCSGLTDEDVLAIRRRYAAWETSVALAAEFRVHPNAVLAIVHGRTWKHLPIEPPRAPLRKSRAGERSLASRLTEAEVRQIRDRHAAGGVSRSDLAAVFGVSPSLVWLIVKRRIWRHVE
jgi:hypothetical protein